MLFSPFQQAGREKELGSLHSPALYLGLYRYGSVLAAHFPFPLPKAQEQQAWLRACYLLSLPCPKPQNGKDSSLLVACFLLGEENWRGGGLGSHSAVQPPHGGAPPCHVPVATDLVQLKKASLSLLNGCPDLPGVNCILYHI